MGIEAPRHRPGLHRLQRFRGDGFGGARDLGAAALHVLADETLEVLRPVGLLLQVRYEVRVGVPVEVEPAVLDGALPVPLQSLALSHALPPAFRCARVSGRRHPWQRDLVASDFQFSGEEGPLPFSRGRLLL